MNDHKRQSAIEHMISFVEDKEKALQSSTFGHDQTIKSTIVKAILDELDCEVAK